jgi:hypothetical protein
MRKLVTTRHVCTRQETHTSTIPQQYQSPKRNKCHGTHFGCFPKKVCAALKLQTGSCGGFDEGIQEKYHGSDSVPNVQINTGTTLWSLDTMKGSTKFVQHVHCRWRSDVYEEMKL